MCGGCTLRLVHLGHSQALLWNSETWAHVHPVWLASGGYGTFPSLLALGWNRSWSCSVTAHSADTSLCAVRVILSLWLLESLLPTTHTFSGALFSPFTLSVKPRLPFYLKCPHFAGPLEDQPGQISVVLGCQCSLGSLKILLVPTSIDTGAKLAVAVTARPSEDPFPLLLEHPVLQLQASLGPNRALCQKQRTEPLRSSLGFNSLWFCSNVLVWICFHLSCWGFPMVLFSHSKHSGSTCCKLLCSLCGAQVRYVLDQCSNPASVPTVCLQCVLRNCSSFLLMGSPWIALSLCLVHPSTVNPRNSEFTFSNVLSLLLPAGPHSRWLHMRPPDWMQRTLSLT